MAKERKISPTKMLESRENPSIEAGFARQPGEEFQNIGIKATGDRVYPNYKILRSMKQYSSLHTHPIAEEDIHWGVDQNLGRNNGPNTPSGGDIEDFLTHPNEKVMHIAQQDPKTGVVAGYFSIKKTKNTPEFPMCPAEESDLMQATSREERDEIYRLKREYEKIPQVAQMKRDIYNLAHAPLLFEGHFDENGKYHIKYTTSKEGKEMIVRRIVASPEVMEGIAKVFERYGLRMRATPAPGFKYLERLGFKRKDPLEVKVEGVAAVLGIGGALSSIFFISSSATGNVIADTANSSLGFMGIGLFIIGLASALFYFKKNGSKRLN